MAGFGNVSYGAGAYGIGTPPVASALGGSVLREITTGKSTGSRSIDANTRDYVIDEYGRTLGMNDVHQLVAMAFLTVRGSSAMRTLGHDLGSIETITDNIERQVEGSVAQALAHLTSRGLVTIVSVVTTRLHPGALRIVVRWRDLTTGAEYDSEI